jgi:hypothetical protein
MGEAADAEAIIVYKYTRKEETWKARSEVAGGGQ